MIDFNQHQRYQITCVHPKIAFKQPIPKNIAIKATQYLALKGSLNSLLCDINYLIIQLEHEKWPAIIEQFLLYKKDYFVTNTPF